MKKDFLKKVGIQFLFVVFLVVFGITMTGSLFADSSNSAGPVSYFRDNSDGSRTLTGHIPLEVRNSTAALKYHATANQNISAQIILPLQNQNQLSAFLKDCYDTKSPNYHRFLTPTQFAEQFGSSQTDSTEVQEFLKKQGISVTGQSPNGAILYVTGHVAAFEQAFRLHINHYQKNDGTSFFAPDADPTIPMAVAGKILAIAGLDNLPKYLSRLHQHPMMELANAIGTGPGGFLAPEDVKTAYNLNSVPANGSGESIALFELDGYSSADIATYEKQFSLPNVTLQNILIDGFSGTPNYGNNGGADEVTLDIELLTAFTSGSTILVYEAPNTTQAWIDEWTKIATDNEAKVVSCSWGEPEADSPTLNFDNIIFQQMAAQGQAIFVAAGDSGAYDAGGRKLAVDEPASQPYVTGVGISKLTTDSSMVYSNETASVYGGGGISWYWPIPSYQAPLVSQAPKSAELSTTMRNVPDTALTADISTAYAFYINGSWSGYYGSSIATPVWASLICCVNEGLGQNGPIGFANLQLYQIAQGSRYANDFHDITTGNNGYYPAETGFDNATGLGSFNGLNLYNDLLKIVSPVTSPATPTGLSVIAGNAQVGLSWNTSTGANYYNVKRSTINMGPYTTIVSSLAHTSYTDNSVTNGNTYYYVVSAVNAVGESPNSVQVNATPLAPTTVAAPTNLTGSTTTYARNPAILLQWKQSSSPNITKNNIYYSVGNGAYSKLGSIPAATAVTVTGVRNGVVYNFYVTAVNSKGLESPPSNKIAITVPLVRYR